MDIHVARQPIFDKRKKLYAYELLFRGEGILGQYLNLVTSYERGDWKNGSGTTTTLGVEENEMAHCYEEAVAWADTICDA